MEKVYEPPTKPDEIGQPNEAAEAVVWLCSPAASYINSVYMIYNGGFLVR